MKTAMAVADLGSPQWLCGPSTCAVVSALETVEAGSARFVGGCVRNTLMGRPVADIDIATKLVPERVIEALEAAGIRAIPTGIEHGTVTAVAGGTPFEITTLRRDIETDGRRAVVTFTRDWAEDAGRRDFRLNALYARLDGRVYDPVDGGLADALAGRVIFIGDPDQRLREDFLRILRFFRFNAWYGAKIDAEGLAACDRQKNGLRQIAAERVWKELKRLLEAPDPVAALVAMAQSGVIGEVLPSLSDWQAGLARLEGLVDAEKVLEIEPDALMRLMVLFARTPSAVAQFISHARLSRQEAGRLHAFAAGRPGPDPLAPEREHRARLYHDGPQRWTEDVLFAAALSPMTSAQYGPLLEFAEAWQRPVLPVGGDDLKAVGLAGPEIGEALGQLEAAWIASDFRLDRGQLLASLVRNRD